MAEQIYDLFVIGGGVNGCGIARDAAGRGYSVYLAEMNDLASGTSSAATKLVHGGLRYLEHYEFRLVRESLQEREVLWAIAPHLVRPLRFILPHHRGLRPAFILRAGLFLYDHIGGRKKLPPARTILNLRDDAAGEPLRGDYGIAFEYSDCWVDDARLVALTAKDASLRGASINTRTEVRGARRRNGVWEIDVQRAGSPETAVIRASMLINAAGPWVDRVLTNIADRTETHNVRLVKGSHIVTEKLFDHDKCYIFQNADGRIVFAIPYEHDFTLIGTTDLDYEGDPANAAIGSEEITYLCEVASEYFKQPVGRGQVVWAYSGVRPLYDDGASKAQEATRDYVLKLDTHQHEAPLLNIFGGKLTTHRRLSEEALELIGPEIGEKGKSWTANSHLPGGDFPMEGFHTEVHRLAKDYPFLSHNHAERLFRLYGTRAKVMLGDAAALIDLGENFGADLTAREVDYLAAEEWAETAEDILWRRTKLGLRFDERGVRALKDYLETKRGTSA